MRGGTQRFHRHHRWSRTDWERTLNRFDRSVAFSVKGLGEQPLDEQERMAIKGFSHIVEQLLGGSKEMVKDPRIMTDVWIDITRESLDWHYYTLER